MAFQGYLRQSTAETVLMGPFVDSGDGDAEEGALTITNSEVRISKNSANIIPKSETTSLVHDELGFYTCLLNTTDTDTVGRLRLMVHETGALLVDQTYWVLEEAIFDAIYAASASAFNASGLVTLAAVTHSGAVIPTVSALTGHTVQTGDSFARIGATGSGLTTLAQAATEAEPGSPPAHTATFQAKIDYIYAALIEKQTLNRSSGARALRNAADSGDISTATDSDDGTTTTRGQSS